MWFTFEHLSGTTAPTVQVAQDAFTQLRVKLGANALPGITIVRMVGHWGIDDTSIAANLIRDWRMGFIVADTTDSGTSVPQTYADDADFMHVDDIFQVPGVTGMDVKSVERSFDIRSQRKIEELDQTLWFSAHNAGESTDRVHVRARILALLP